MKSNFKLIDNSSKDYLLSETLKNLFKNPSVSEVSIATGYWDLPAIALLQSELSYFFNRGNTRLHLLLGEEPSVRSYQIKNPSKPDPDFPQKYLKRDLETLSFKDEYSSAAKLLQEFSSENADSRFEIRVYKKSFLHAKCYIFGSEEENAIGIIGSSNFTKQGLEGNLELNQVEDNNATVNYIRKNISQHPSHRSWFESLWQESEPWTKVFVEEILTLSRHGSMCYSPYEMYIHSLYRIFGEDLNDEKNSVFDKETEDENSPTLFPFQVKNSNSLIKKLERQSVAMLSDSVGLGKTYTAIKVISYYKNIKNQRVVIVAPASLIPQWQSAFNDFQFAHLPEIYSLQDIAKIKQTREVYNIPIGLFVFDESHNLRGSGGDRFKEFIDWRRLNPNSKTLLLTATPINNQLTDLTNQIMLGSGGEFQTIGKFYDRSRSEYITFEDRIQSIQKEIKRQIRETRSVDYSGLREQLTPLLNKVIVKRTRQGIEKEYPEGLEINGKKVKFPQSIPDNLEYEVPNQYRSDLLKLSKEYPLLSEALNFNIDSLAELKFLAHPLDLFDHYSKREKPIHSSLEIIYSAILCLGFPCYRYNIYRHEYYGINRDDLNLDVDDNRLLTRQIGIYGIFRTVFLKRLESSIFSIQKSIITYEKKLTDFKNNLLKYNRIFSIKNLDALNKVLDSYNEQNAEEDELDIDIDSFDFGENAPIEASNAHFRIETLKEDIEKDLRLLDILKKQIQLLIKKDDKIAVLAKHLNTNDDRKVLVFTYFADTLQYLKEHLPQLLTKGKNVEFALGTKNEVENFACRFAPNAKKYALKQGEKEIDYLLATDKLSEGQNLQDCGMIVNYDLHWNPVRMIQRNGRINRIGSPFEEIFIYNFRPTEQLESYLNLVSKLQDKINLIRYSVGTDQSVLDEEPISQEFSEDLYSRDEQKRLAAFQRIFETSELLATDDIFLEDLREFDRNTNFSESYKQSIINLPKGKWGKIQRKKDDDGFNYLVHFSAGTDTTESSGYFFLFKRQKSEIIPEQITLNEGLLYIKASVEQNKRFRDNFKEKAPFETYLEHFKEYYQIPIAQHNNRFNEAHREAIGTLLRRMITLGYAENDIMKVDDFINHTSNSFLIKETRRLIRDINRANRRGNAFDDGIIQTFLKFSEQPNSSTGEEIPSLADVLQVFTV
ncbi:MAG: helicase-related protein [Chloroherpetonaceae bacterium]|nr:helicase-related protein [Chloroherpetonaceae bacterium]